MDGVVVMCIAGALFAWALFIIFAIYIIKKDLRQKPARDFLKKLDMEEFKNPIRRSVFLELYADKIMEDKDFRDSLEREAKKKKIEDIYNGKK